MKKFATAEKNEDVSSIWHIYQYNGKVCSRDPWWIVDRKKCTTDWEVEFNQQSILKLKSTYLKYQGIQKVEPSLHR